MLEDVPQTECAMIFTRKMPHLLLASFKSENDASITKTLSRRLYLFIRSKLDDLFVEAKALLERLWKLNRKREVDGFKVFHKQMESGKKSNTYDVFQTLQSAVCYQHLIK